MKLKKETIFTIFSAVLFLIILAMLCFVLNIKSFVKNYSYSPNQNLTQKEDAVIVEKTKIVFADNFVGAKSIIEQFEQKYEGIDIELIELPQSKQEAQNVVISAMRVGDKTPDIICADVLWIETLAKNGWIYDVTESYSKINSEFLPSVLDSVTYNGRYYGIPISADSLVLVYRTDLCETPPKTWQGLIDRSKSFKEQFGLSPLLWSGGNDEDLALLLTSLLFSANGQTNMPDYSAEQVSLSIDFLKSTISQKISPPEVLHMSEVDVAKQFAKEKSAFAIISTEYLSLIEQNNNLKGKYSIVRIPTYTGDDVETKSILRGESLVLNKNSEHKDEALLFMEFYASLKNQQQMLEENKQMPTLTELYKSPNITQQEPIISQMFNILNSALDVKITKHNFSNVNNLSNDIYALLSDVHGINQDELLYNISQEIISKLS